MDFMTFIDLFLLIGLLVMIGSIPYFLSYRKELEEKGFEVNQFLIRTVVVIIAIILALFVFGK